MAKFEDITVDLKLNYNIKTIINGKEIQQIISSEDFIQNKFSQISNQIYNTAEEQLRNTLIELGWKPPKE